MKLTKEQAFAMYWGQKTIFNNDLDTIEVMGRDIFVNMKYLRNDKLKLILRPFENMDDKEASIFNSYYKDEVDTINHYKLIPKSTEYLISIGIDVFNLKDREWAVYESDLKERSEG